MRKDKVKYLDELFQELITSSDKTIWEYIREIQVFQTKRSAGKNGIPDYITKKEAG